MTAIGWLQNLLYLALLLVLALPLGRWMAAVYESRVALDGSRTLLGFAWPWWRSKREPGSLPPVERAIYRLTGVDPEREMTWRAYAAATLGINLVGLLAVYALQRLQHLLPGNPDQLATVVPHLAWNTAVSFATNTNWQSYGGETTLSYLTQMAGLTVQNFLSAATGMAVLAAMVRGFVRKSATTIGNFWVDLTRTTLYVLLPLAIVLGLLLMSQGVVQTLEPAATAALVEPREATDGTAVAAQTLARGPAASQIAIKQLGTNGGGFFNVNSSHPFENPTPVSNLLEALAILLIPIALCFTLGHMVGDRRQGWALLAAMTLLFLPLLVGATWAEQTGNPALRALGVDDQPSALQAGGNMEGKEVRNGIVSSAQWATATTAASNGSVSSMHDSYTPLGGLVPMLLMQLGEVVYGGVGSGLYGMLLFVVVAVFVAGLMVGRTPEYLGKKIEAHEMKLAALGILGPCFAVLLGTAVAAVCEPGLAGRANPGAHGFAEILYAFSSAGNNNGSAFAGLTASTPFYDTALGLTMLVARYVPMLAALGIAGSLVGKRKVSVGPGTLPTHGPLFIVLLAAVVVVVGALTFIPALALGPIVEHLQLAALR